MRLKESNAFGCKNRNNSFFSGKLESVVDSFVKPGSERLYHERLLINLETFIILPEKILQVLQSQC